MDHRSFTLLRLNRHGPNSLRMLLHVASTCGLLLAIACGRADVRAVTVIIPGDRDAIIGCNEISSQHELSQQRTILCRPDMRTRFVLFDYRHPEALAPLLETASSSDAIELPFEMCPEAVSADLRARVERNVAQIVSVGKQIVAAAGNEGSLDCARRTPERFPADLAGIISVGAGSLDRPGYTLRWRDKPDYFVSWDDETLGSAGTSFAAARFVLWRFGITDYHVHVTRAGTLPRSARRAPTSRSPRTADEREAHDRDVQQK